MSLAWVQNILETPVIAIQAALGGANPYGATHPVEAATFSEQQIEQTQAAMGMVPVTDKDFLELVEKSVLPEVEEAAVYMWGVIIAMWNKIPPRYRKAFKFVMWVIICAGLAFFPFMIIIIHYFYTFIKNNPQILLL